MCAENAPVVSFERARSCTMGGGTLREHGGPEENQSHSFRTVNGNLFCRIDPSFCVKSHQTVCSKAHSLFLSVSLSLSLSLSLSRWTKLMCVSKIRKSDIQRFRYTISRFLIPEGHPRRVRKSSHITFLKFTYVKKIRE
jgi:hypothetical protein